MMNRKGYKGRKGKLKLMTASLKDEMAWERRVVKKALGDALRPDGTIDFERLYASGDFVGGAEMHKDFPDLIDEDGHITL